MKGYQRGDHTKVEKKKFKINWVDIIIIVVALVAIVFAYKFTHKEVAVETKTIRYTFELVDNPIGFTDKIKIGDDITDNIKNYYMGKVVEVEKTTYTKVIQDVETGTYKEAVVEGRETAIVTVEASVTENGGNLNVDGYYLVKGGLEVAVKGNGYAGRGFILSVERQEGQ